MESLEKYWPIIITLIAIMFVMSLALLLSDIERVHAQIAATEQEIQDKIPDQLKI